MVGERRLPRQSSAEGCSRTGVLGTAFTVLYEAKQLYDAVFGQGSEAQRGMDALTSEYRREGNRLFGKPSACSFAELSAGSRHSRSRLQALRWKTCVT